MFVCFSNLFSSRGFLYPLVFLFCWTKDTKYCVKKSPSKQLPSDLVVIHGRRVVICVMTLWLGVGLKQGLGTRIWTLSSSQFSPREHSHLHVGHNGQRVWCWVSSLPPVLNRALWYVLKTDFQVDQMAHSVKFPRAQEKNPGVVLYTYNPHAEIGKKGCPGPVG